MFFQDLPSKSSDKCIIKWSYNLLQQIKRLSFIVGLSIQKLCWNMWNLMSFSVLLTTIWQPGADIFTNSSYCFHCSCASSCSWLFLSAPTFFMLRWFSTCRQHVCRFQPHTWRHEWHSNEATPQSKVESGQQRFYDILWIKHLVPASNSCATRRTCRKLSNTLFGNCVLFRSFSLVWKQLEIVILRPGAHALLIFNWVNCQTSSSSSLTPWPQLDL